MYPNCHKTSAIIGQKSGRHEHIYGLLPRFLFGMGAFLCINACEGDISLDYPDQCTNGKGGEPNVGQGGEPNVGQGGEPNIDCVETCSACTLGSACSPARSCASIRANQPDVTDGLYWIDPLKTAPTQVFCDMSGGGWTLVYRATNSGGIIENGLIDGPEAIGITPFTPESEGQFKLDDAVINALRSDIIINNLKVAVYINHRLLGIAWHPKECILQSGTELPKTDICNRSTREGPHAANQIQSGHKGMLGRWYVDGTLGYLLPLTHIGPIEGGTAHANGELPLTYCTWYDERTCPTNSQIEIWAY